MDRIKRPWYLSTFVILLLAALSFLIVPLIGAIILAIIQFRYDKEYDYKLREAISDENEEIRNKIIEQAQSKVTELENIRTQLIQKKRVACSSN